MFTFQRLLAVTRHPAKLRRRPPFTVLHPVWAAIASMTLLASAHAQTPPPAPAPTRPAPAPAAPATAVRPAPPAAPAGRAPVPPHPAVGAAKPPGAKPLVKKVDPKQREEARAKLLQRIRGLRAQELAEVLKPDATAVAKVVEIAAGYEDKVIATRQDQRQRRADLDKLLKDPKPNDVAISRLVDELLAGRKRLEDIEYERTAAFRKVLNPSQFAKVVVSWPRINRKIQETLYRALLKSKSDAAAIGFEE